MRLDRTPIRSTSSAPAPPSIAHQQREPGCSGANPAPRPQPLTLCRHLRPQTRSAPSAMQWAYPPTAPPQAARLSGSRSFPRTHGTCPGSPRTSIRARQSQPLRPRGPALPKRGCFPGAPSPHEIFHRASPPRGVPCGNGHAPSRWRVQPLCLRGLPGPCTSHVWPRRGGTEPHGGSEVGVASRRDRITPVTLIFAMLLGARPFHGTD